jgi:hypothetical protein
MEKSQELKVPVGAYRCSCRKALLKVYTVRSEAVVVLWVMRSRSR